MGRDDTIRREISDRGISSLLHFPNVLNLPGILAHGILSRRDILARGLSAYVSHAGRLDGEDSAISVSIASVDFRMLDANRATSPGATWMILALDPNILWRLECRFHPSNVASNYARWHSAHAGSTTAFLRLFENWREAGPEGARSYREGRSIPPALPTDPGAEVQVLHPIPPQMIMATGVEDERVAALVRPQLAVLSDYERPVTVGYFRETLATGSPVLDRRKRQTRRGVISPSPALQIRRGPSRVRPAPL